MDNSGIMISRGDPKTFGEINFFSAIYFTMNLT
jgi:hypothetical protein